MSGIIYTIRNQVNGKVYAGQTSQSLARRKAEHLTRERKGDRDHKLYLAMKKHGCDKFVFEEICSALQPQHLDALEIAIIEQFNSYHRGYNSNPGGHGVSQETKEKLRTIHTGRVVTWGGKIAASWKANGNVGRPQPKGAAHKAAASYVVGCPDDTIRRVTGLKAFCRENNLTFKAMYDTLAGKQSHHKGFALFAKISTGSERLEA